MQAGNRVSPSRTSGLRGGPSGFPGDSGWRAVLEAAARRPVLVKVSGLGLRRPWVGVAYTGMLYGVGVELLSSEHCVTSPQSLSWEERDR